VKIIVAVSGASGVELGLRLIRNIPMTHELFVVATDHAKIVADSERQVTLLEDSDIGASIASGSFGADIMAVVPCSMNTLAKIACGIADNLTTRAAAVMLKERRPLILAPRELPFDAIALENMLKLSRLGVIIAPPVMGYYSGATTLEGMEDFLVGKWLDQMGIDHNLYQRWQG